MYIQKFFYLTIQGDALDLDEAQQLIKLPCKIFHFVSLSDPDGNPIEITGGYSPTAEESF